MDYHERARLAYPHRYAANPEACPVCCGDRRTTDPAFGTTVVGIMFAGTCNEHSVFACNACERRHSDAPAPAAGDRRSPDDGWGMGNGQAAE